MTKQLKIESVKADPKNPRQDFYPEVMKTLEISISKHGVLNPIIVEETDKDGEYLLVDGERRLRASKKVGLKEIPAQVLPQMSEMDRLIKRFHVQELQESWNSFEKANAINILKQETGWNDEEIAKALGMASTTIRNYNAILTLSKRSKQFIVDKKLPLSWAVEVGNITKKAEDENLRVPLENALIRNTESGLVNRSGDLRRYSIAIKVGGDKIIKEIIKNPKFTPSQALVKSGANWNRLAQSVRTSFQYSAGSGMNLFKHLASKNQKLPEGIERAMNNLKKAIALLEKL